MYFFHLLDKIYLFIALTMPPSILENLWINLFAREIFISTWVNKSEISISLLMKYKHTTQKYFLSLLKYYLLLKPCNKQITKELTILLQWSYIRRSSRNKKDTTISKSCFRKVTGNLNRDYSTFKNYRRFIQLLITMVF